MKRDPAARIPMAPMTELVAALCADAVQVQRVFDTAQGQDLLRYRDLFAQLGDFLGPGAGTWLAPRMMLRSFEISTRVAVSVERTHGVEVRVLPLNIGYDLRYGSTATSESRIRVRVEQVPCDHPLPVPAVQPKGE
jgi:hypothetical protein